MGVWSSIRNPRPKQILSLDLEAFNTSVLKDVKEIKIQESLSNIDYLATSSPAAGTDEEIQRWSTNFEYSMGGNLKFYKEHFKQDYLKAKLWTAPTFSNQPPVRPSRKQRNVSISDHDSDPESVRYSKKKYQAPTNNIDVITEQHGAELSFDDYSAIYQPELLLNVKPQSLPMQSYKEDQEGTNHIDVSVNTPSVKAFERNLDRTHVEDNTSTINAQRRLVQFPGKSSSRVESVKDKVNTKKTKVFSVQSANEKNYDTEKNGDRQQDKPVMIETNTRPVESLEKDSAPAVVYLHHTNMVKIKTAPVHRSVAQNVDCVVEAVKKDAGVQIVQQSEEKKVKAGQNLDMKKAKKIKTTSSLPYVEIPETIIPEYGEQNLEHDNVFDYGDYFWQEMEENITRKDELLQKGLVVSGWDKLMSKKTNKAVGIKHKNLNSVEVPDNKKNTNIKDLKVKSKKEGFGHPAKKLTVRDIITNIKPRKIDGIEPTVKANIRDNKNKQGKKFRSRNVLEDLPVVNISLEDDHCLHMEEQITGNQENDTNWFNQINTRKNNELLDKEMPEFYPASPTGEVNFFKTPCSTRHNSAGSLEDFDYHNEDLHNIQQNDTKLKDDALLSIDDQRQRMYAKLPKEFQEMAKRLSKNNELPKARPSLHQVNSISNCSSSTSSGNSPRSPSGRTLSRTPSYKMPKTPSLSRQHPATYVTQHTSSRSRSSSRVSSRAPSPTRDPYYDRASINTFI